MPSTVTPSTLEHDFSVLDLRHATADDAAELRALARRSGESGLRGPVVLAARGGTVVAARSMRSDVLHFDRSSAPEERAALDAFAERAGRRRFLGR